MNQKVMRQEFENALRMSKFAEEPHGLAIGETGKFQIEKNRVQYLSPSGDWVVITNQNIDQRISEIISA